MHMIIILLSNACVPLTSDRQRGINRGKCSYSCDLLSNGCQHACHIGRKTDSHRNIMLTESDKSKRMSVALENLPL